MNFCTDGDVRVILNIVHYLYLGIIIVVPIILIIVGMLDLAKAVTEKKDDDTTKAQQSLIKKAISAALVFLVPVIVSALISGLLKNSEYKQCWNVIVRGTSSTENSD